RRGAAFGIENLDVEADVLEVALLEADVDEGAVPKAALGDRDLQGFGRSAFRRHHCDQHHRQCQYFAHDILLCTAISERAADFTFPACEGGWRGARGAANSILLDVF